MKKLYSKFKLEAFPPVFFFVKKYINEYLKKKRGENADTYAVPWNMKISIPLGK